MHVQENKGKSIPYHSEMEGKSPYSSDHHSVALRDSRNRSSTSASLIARLGCVAASPTANWRYWYGLALQFRNTDQGAMVGRWQNNIARDEKVVSFW